MGIQPFTLGNFKIDKCVTDLVLETRVANSQSSSGNTMKLKQNFDILGSVAYSAVKVKRLNCSGKRIRKDNDLIRSVYFHSRPNSDKLINKIL